VAAGEVAAGREAAAPVVPLRRNRDFRWLWTGQAVSALGSQISAVAYPLLVLAMTGSAARAGVAGFSSGLPYLIFPLLAGAVADRWNRKRIMICCDLARLATLASIAAAGMFGAITYPQILVAGFVGGTGFVFFALAQRAAVPVIVHPRLRAAAVAHNEARTHAATLAGPPLGGLLFGVSRLLPFAADALSYVVSLMTLPFIRTPLQRPRADCLPPRARLRRELAEGLAVTWHQPFLRAAAGFSAAVNFILQGVTLAIIVLARDHGASAQLVGIILGAKGIGGLAGAAAAPWLQRRIPAGLVIIGCLWIWGTALAVMVTVPGPVWLCPPGVMLGFTLPAWNVAVQAYRLKLIPNELLGRVSSVTMQLGWGAIPLGSLAAGYLLAGLGPVRAMLVLAAAMVFTAATAIATPAIRRTAAGASGAGAGHGPAHSGRA
jgi:predicted MFS family arabinose efflux permease